MNPKIKEALAAIGALARAGIGAWPKSISFGILQDIRVQVRAALALCDEEPTLGEELDIYERVVSICGQDRANKLIDLFKITSRDKQPAVPMAMRGSVIWFAQQMERKLQKHDADYGPSGWEHTDLNFLWARLYDEYHEARKATGTQEIIDECADIANFAMMIADIHNAAGYKVV